MFVIKNLTNRDLTNVQYRILMDGGNEVAFGRVYSLAAGQQVEVRGTVPGSWLTTAGPRLFTGVVDPNNLLNESSSSQGNNMVDKSVTVYRVATVGPTEPETPQQDSTDGASSTFPELPRLPERPRLPRIQGR